MDFKLLENVVAIAEERSISRAADRMFISQPALSQQLSKLEAQMGTRLFFRGKTQVTLTQAGEVYVENAKKVLAIRNETYNRIYDITNMRKGTLRIGVSPGRSPMIVSTVYPEFQKEYPEFTIQVFDRFNMYKEELLLEGKLDLAFYLQSDSELAISDHQLSRATLGRENIYLIASRNNPVATRYHHGSKYPVIDLKLFEKEPFALTTKEGKTRQIADEIFTSHEIVPDIRYEVFNIQAIIRVVSRSNLLSLIPAGFLDPEDSSIIAFRLNPNRFVDFFNLLESESSPHLS